jgi:hypothetical protein
MALPCRGARLWPARSTMLSGCFPCSAGRPGHLAAAEHVRVHVGHGLASVGAGVEDDAVTGAGDALGDRHLVGVRDQVRQQAVASGRQLGQVGVVRPRDHKYVNGSLRINVTEGDRARITGHYDRRYVSGSNGTEQAVRHAEDLNVYRAGDAADIYGCSTANPRCATPLVQRLASLWLSVARG